MRKIGLILYASVIGRPDIAFAASQLARFNTNPLDDHRGRATVTSQGTTYDSATTTLQYAAVGAAALPHPNIWYTVQSQ